MTPVQLHPTGPPSLLPGFVWQIWSNDAVHWQKSTYLHCDAPELWPCLCSHVESVCVFVSKVQDWEELRPSADKGTSGPCSSSPLFYSNNFWLCEWSLWTFIRKLCPNTTNLDWFRTGAESPLVPHWPWRCLRLWSVPGPDWLTDWLSSSGATAENRPPPCQARPPPLRSTGSEGGTHRSTHVVIWSLQAVHCFPHEKAFKEKVQRIQSPDLVHSLSLPFSLSDSPFSEECLYCAEPEDSSGVQNWMDSRLSPQTSGTETDGKMISVLAVFANVGIYIFLSDWCWWNLIFYLSIFW